jgi:hypothetical protein
MVLKKRIGIIVAEITLAIIIFACILIFIIGIVQSVRSDYICKDYCKQKGTSSYELTPMGGLGTDIDICSCLFSERIESIRNGDIKHE